MLLNYSSDLPLDSIFFVSQESLPSKSMILFEDMLCQGVTLRLQVTGRSMTPFLCSGEVVTIRPVPPETVQIGDLIFFKTRQGGLILHRLIKKIRTPHGIFFQTKGDALRSLDHPLPAHNLLGKVCQIEKPPAGHRAGTTLYLERPHWQGVNYLLAQIHRLTLTARRIERGVKRIVKQVGWGVKKG